MAQGLNLNQVPNQEYITRRDQTNKLLNQGKVPQRVSKDLALNYAPANGANWFSPAGRSPLVGCRGVGESRVRWSLSGCKRRPGRTISCCSAWCISRTAEICQGIVLDGPALQAMLVQEVTDLFPEARLESMREAMPSQPERTMTALPFQLDPGPSPAATDPGWTPLRVGLALAWLAALIALLGRRPGRLVASEPLGAAHSLRVGRHPRTAHAADDPAAVSRHAGQWSGARREAARRVHPHAARRDGSTQPPGRQCARFLASGESTAAPQSRGCTRRRPARTGARYLDGTLSGCGKRDDCREYPDDGRDVAGQIASWCSRCWAI